MNVRQRAASAAHGKLAKKFVPFTEHSLQKIADRIAADKLRQQRDADPDKRLQDERDEKTARARAETERRKDKPNTAFVAGKQFPQQFGSFPSELCGKPIEDLDEFYNNKYVSTFNLSTDKKVQNI